MPKQAPTPPSSRCTPRIDQLISEAVVGSLSERQRVAAEEGNFAEVLTETVTYIQGLRAELEMAAERYELLPLILSYLEVSYFTELAWGGLSGLTCNDAVPPTLEFLEWFQAWAIDMQLKINGPDRHDESAIPPSFLCHINAFEAMHGRYGLQVLLTAIRQFVDRHEKTPGVSVVTVRGGHAGCNDGYLGSVFCSRAREFACCVALHINDVCSFAFFATKGTDARRLAARAQELLGSGSPITALRWLELDSAEKDLGDYSSPNSIMNLRILVARRMEDRDALQRHLVAAYLKTFERQYFLEILGLFSGPDQKIARAHLIGLAESANETKAYKAFKLLLDERETTSLERLLALYYDRPMLLVGISVDRHKLEALISSCKEHAPEVARHLQKLSVVR